MEPTEVLPIQKTGTSLKNKIIIATIVVILIVGTGTTIYFVKQKKNAAPVTPPLPAFKPNVAIENKPPSPGKQKIVWRNDSFPLSLGSKGQNVKSLQQFLGVTPNDGYFGYDTETALKNKTGKTKVMTESEYTSPSPSTSSSPFKVGGKVYANAKINIYHNPDTSFLVGYLKQFDQVGTYIGLSTVSGWSKIQLPGYYDWDGSFINQGGVYFVYTKDLTDKKA